MRKLLRMLAVIFGILAVLGVVWVALVVHLFTGVHSHVPERVYSPDQSRVVIPTVNSDKGDFSSYLLVHLRIQDVGSGKTLFEVQTRASDRMRWAVTWVDNHTVKLDSSDIGAYCWTDGNDGVWTEVSCP